MTDQRFGLIAGRYVLRDRLGAGGMGRVWLAYDEMLDREVAIKEVAPRGELTPEESDELCRLILHEAKATARINHPHVVRIYDVIQVDEWPWIVMELIPSLSLQKVVKHDGPLPPGDVAVIGLAVLDALNAAHQAGILHRDVKPDNVLIGEDGRVVLTDFGLASVEADGTVTVAGRLGTPQYVAPERARRGISSREADLWSLGATLYAAVEGRSPYKRDSVMETLTALAVEHPDPMRLAGPLMPVITGLLRRDPAERLKPKQVEEALKAVVRGESPIQRTNPARVVVAAAIVAVAVLGFAAADAAPAALIPAGVAACDIRMPAEPVPSYPTPPGQYALPQGWNWYTEADRFSVAVPGHWTYWRVDGAVCFRDPSSTRVLAIGTGPVELPGFELIESDQVQLAQPAWEREFTYDGDERKRRAITLITESMTLLWACDDFDFQPSRSLYNLVRGSFQAYTSTS